MLIKKIIHPISKLSLNSPWLMIFIFAFIGLIGIFNHAMWRDELNPWLIAKDSQSFGDLISNIRYEGHPVLWYFCLALVNKIADTPIMMQLLHLGITTTAVAIFWLCSPFNQLQKLLFTFGYFPFYEYLLISRNYAFSFLFVFAFCAIFPCRKRNYWQLAVLLGLLANSSAYALFVSLALSMTLVMELCFDRQHRHQYFSQSNKYDFFISSVIIIFAFGLAINIMTPPADSYLHGGLKGWFTEFDFRHLLRSFGRLFGGYFLIIPTHKRWLDLIICACISIFVFGLTVLKLRKKPIPLFFYTLGTGIILSFTYLRFLGNPRHYGHFYLILLAALWLTSYYPDSESVIKKVPFFRNRSWRFVDKWHYIALMLIFYVQLLGGIGNYGRDLFIPFSASKATANYIQESRLSEEFIVASRDANMAALSGYLHRQFYYPELQRLGSFTIFGKGRKSVDQGEALRQVSELLNGTEANKKILLILHEKLQSNYQGLQINPVKSFEKAWVDTERFYLYWVQKE
jgi:hypothetical protein